MTRRSLPIRRRDFDAQGFLAYLAEQGCEIGKPSNPYEVVRYRAYWQDSKKPVTQIVYAKDNGLLTWMQGTQAHYLSFLEGRGIAGNNPPFVSQFNRGQPGAEAVAKERPGKAASKTAITREKLLARDGGECWFCGKPMGDDCTIEHLIPKSKGGRNTADNYALAHAACNNAAADKPLVAKIAMRAEMRGEKA